MNIFILSTGRCGSTSFIKACQHAVNYTAGKETRYKLLFPKKWEYPVGHIESDPRLWCQLQVLDQYFPSAWYVHLTRDVNEVIDSYVHKFTKRSDPIGQMRAWAELRGRRVDDPRELALDMIITMRTTIDNFIMGRPHMTIDINDVERKFEDFWIWGNLRGDMEAAQREFLLKHNARDNPAGDVNRPDISVD